MAFFGIIAKGEASRRLLAETPTRLFERWGFADDGRWRVNASRGTAFHFSEDGALGVDREGFTYFEGDTPPAAPLHTSECHLVAELPGAFAAVFWNSGTATLTIARDHFGQRQVFYRQGSDFLVFSSDVRGLLADSSWEPGLDPESAVSYLLWGRPAPGRSVARGIRTLPAAHALLYRSETGLLQLLRYWTPLLSGPPRAATKSDLAEIERCLRDSTERRLDVGTTAILLSGGVDSSLLAAMARNTSRNDLETYTIQYESEFGRQDEHYARTVAKRLGVHHHLVPLADSDAFTHFGEVLSSPTPLSAWTAISHRHLLGAVASNGRKVLLSGMGADEIFGGYDHFLDYHFRLRQFAHLYGDKRGVDWFDRLLRQPRLATRYLFPGIAMFFASTRLFRLLSPAYAPLARITFTEDFYAECRRIDPDTHPCQMMTGHECQHRIPDLLMTTFDPLAREHGISLRYPYLDLNVVRRACALPASERYWYANGHWWAKKTLRRIARSWLPQSIIMRKRAAYGVPISAWMRGSRFGDLALARIADSRIWNTALFKRSARSSMVAGFKKLQTTESLGQQLPSEVWAILTLASWYDAYGYSGKQRPVRV